MSTISQDIVTAAGAWAGLVLPPAAATTTPTTAAGYELTPGGWFVMITSVTFVTTLLAWCVYRVLRESSARKIHSQIDIEPVDKVPD